MSIKSTIPSYLTQEIVWLETTDTQFPYATQIGKAHWKIRLNNFPESPLYTLMIEGKPILDFDDWPTAWLRI